MFYLDESPLTIEDIWSLTAQKASDSPVGITDLGKQRIRKSHSLVQKALKTGKSFYGINTGFGALSEVRISDDELGDLQKNLIRSHCTGVGKALTRRETRAMLILRCLCLIQGHSGVSLELVNAIIDFINHDVYPLVPEQGSVGASGDLAPLAHLALPLIGEGYVIYQYRKRPSGEVLEELGLKPVTLGPKEGLALINGTQMMTAMGALNLYLAEETLKLADMVAAVTVEAIRGTRDAFDEKIHAIRPHPMQMVSAENIRKILSETSEIAQSHKDCGKVQDPYSIRCTSQVHGASRNMVEHAIETIEIEINSVTDNPLVFENEDGTIDLISGGNFHGEPVAKALDVACMGISEISSISERRTDKLVNSSFSGLAPFLIEKSGLNSGLMIAHVTAAALLSENKGLCHPSSCDSIPTSAEKEDHVSMGPISARQLRQCLKNTRTVLAIELLSAWQGLNLLKPMKSSPAIEKIREVLDSEIEPIDSDRMFSEDIAKINKMFDDGRILSACQGESGFLL